MSFPKEKLADELRSQVVALVPTFKKMRFESNLTSHYFDQFYHRRSGVSVKVTPIKDKMYGYFSGFKLKIERNNHPGRGSHFVMVKLDNLEAVRTAVKDSIKYIRDRKERDREKANFKTTLEKTLPRLFPGRDRNVYSGDAGTFLVSISRKDHSGSWFDIKVDTEGTVSEIKISYPGKPLDEVAKMLLEKW